MAIRTFTLWLAARLLMVLGVVFTLMVITTVGVAKHDTTLASQVLWVVLLSVLCYGGGVACYVTRKLSPRAG